MKPEQLEIDRLKREVTKLKAERDILKKAAAYFAKDSGVKFAFIAKHRGVWPVTWMCEALGVSRSGFFAWLTRAAKRAREKRCRPRQVVGDSFERSDRTYGARRVWHDVLAEGFSCGLHRVERLMRAHASRPGRAARRLPKDAGERSIIAGNILDRQFEAQGPNRRWVADFTYIWTARRLALCRRRSRPLLAADRRLVDERADDRPARHRRADDGALAARQAGRAPASFRSGKSVYERSLPAPARRHGVDCSMSRSGNCWDNAAMESFFSSLKTERAARRTLSNARRRQRPTCSITSNASTIRSAVTRPSAISAPWTSNAKLG